MTFSHFSKGLIHPVSGGELVTNGKVKTENEKLKTENGALSLHQLLWHNTLRTLHAASLHCPLDSKPKTLNPKL